MDLGKMLGEDLDGLGDGGYAFPGPGAFPVAVDSPCFGSCNKEQERKYFEALGVFRTSLAVNQREARLCRYKCSGRISGLGAVNTQPYSGYASASTPYRYGTGNWWQTYYLPQYYSQAILRNPMYTTYGIP